MSATIRNCVRTYLEEWLETDRHARNSLSPDGTLDDTEKLSVLNNFARAYGIRRNFSSTDKENALLPALRILEATSLQADINATYVDFFQRLSNEYGKNLWSASSKLLWARFGSPFRLYDQYADLWMRKAGYKISQNPANWYQGFCAAWEERYRDQRSNIEDACGALIEFAPYFATEPDLIADIETVLSDPWFHERVFDHYISWAEDAI